MGGFADPEHSDTEGWSRPVGGGTQNKKDILPDVLFVLERDTGVEPATSAWEADVLPIYQSRTDLVSEGIITDPRRICKTNPVESAQPAIPAETYALHPMLRQSIGHGSGRRFSPGARAFRRAARRKSPSKQA